MKADWNLRRGAQNCDPLQVRRKYVFKKILAKWVVVKNFTEKYHLNKE